MAVSKVVYGENTLIDLTSDTVTAAHLEQGYTAHAADGSLIIGTMIPLTDTGWIDFSPKSGFSTQLQLKKRRIGNIVFITGAVRNSTQIAQGAYGVLVDDIGDDFRPSLTQNMIPVGGDYAGWVMYVDSTGKLQLRNRTGSARTDTYISCHCSYAV